MKPVPGICDRCSLRWPLEKLKFEYVLGTNTRKRVCPDCLDSSHPQLDTKYVETSDKQSVDDSRPDTSELTDVRNMFGWNPVGGDNASTYIEVELGNVTVTT